jgi:hypothetical protein
MNSPPPSHSLTVNEMLAEDVMPCILVCVRSAYHSALRASCLTNACLLALLSERI